MQLSHETDENTMCNYVYSQVFSPQMSAPKKRVSYMRSKQGKLGIVYRGAVKTPIKNKQHVLNLLYPYYNLKF